MQHLIKQLTAKYGISTEQATGALETIKEYAEQKLPGLGNSLNSILNENHDASSEQSKENEKKFFEKATFCVEDNIPGLLEEKSTKVLGGMGSKIKNMFS